MGHVYVYSLMYDILYNSAIKDVGLRLIVFWVCGFEPHRDMDVCLLGVLCCQLLVSASGLSLVHRNPAELNESWYDREDGVMKRPWPTRV
jgi:hypothetical protein